MPLTAVDMFLRREMKKQNKKQKKEKKRFEQDCGPKIESSVELNHGFGELLHCFNPATYMSPH